MGVCLALTEPCPLADKHCQLAAGLHSLAMCSLLINRTHSRRQVQANTKPFPWAVGFSSCLHRCQLKRFLLFSKAVRPLWGPLWKVWVVGWGVGVGVNSLLYCFFVSVLMRDPSPNKTRNKNHALGLTILNALKRTGNGNCPLYEVYLFFFLLVLSGFWKVEKKILLCCPEVHGFVQLLVGQLLLWDGKHHLSCSFISDLGQISYFRLGGKEDIFSIAIIAENTKLTIIMF